MFRKSIVMVAVLAVVLLGSATAIEAGELRVTMATSAGQQAGQQMGAVLATRLNVRAGPGLAYQILGQLRQGERVEIVDRQNGWLEIAYPAATGGTAWVSGAYVQIDGEPAPTGQVAARPATAASGGKLVFQTRNGGDIYVIGADGTGLRKLTNGFEPVWSPDGAQVAFARFSMPMGLYLIDANGGNERLVFGANRPRSPSWAPDGGAIVLEWSPRSEDCRWLPGMGCVSEQRWNEISGGADCAVVSGKEICYGAYPKSTRYFTNLTRVDLATGAARDLPASPMAVAPAHHPADGRVLYLAKEGLYSTRSENGQAPQLVINLPNQVGPGVFSLDGQAIYGMRRTGDHWDIWRWNADGSGALALTSQPAQSSRPVNNVSPAVSPTGREVVFLSDRNGKWQMYVMNSDGSNQRPFAPQALAAIDFAYDFNADRMVHWGK